MQHNEIKGFTDQSEKNKAAINENKILEERVLRQVDTLAKDSAYDQRMIMLARTNIQQSFMWLNRAIFQPTRINLPEDNPAKPNDVPMPPVHIGEVFRSHIKDETAGETALREVVTGRDGRELVARGPNWYRKDEIEEYERQRDAMTNEGGKEPPSKRNMPGLGLSSNPRAG